MCLLKSFLAILLSFNILQNSMLHASDVASTKMELSLTHSLVRTKKIKDNKLFYYQLHLTSREKLAGTKLKMIVINSADQPVGHTDIWFDKEEKVWIYEGGKNLPLEEFETTFDNFSDGEFVDIIVVDGSHVLAGTRICPKPIECRAADGAIVSLELQSPEGQYALRGYGFKPNESLLLISQSEEEVIPASAFEASVEGTITGFISPQVIGKSYGHASFTLIRQDGAKLKLSYLWGITEEKLAAMDAEKKKIGV
jgi:hypothetical protein